MKKYVPAVFWMVLIFALSSMPGSALPKLPFCGFDKIVHIVEYAVLGFLLAKAINKKIVMVVLIGIVYSLSDELHQIFVPFREFSLMDLLSDAIGVCTGVVCLLLLKKYQSAH
jgi:VanZ family protein